DERAVVVAPDLEERLLTAEAGARVLKLLLSIFARRELRVHMAVDEEGRPAHGRGRENPDDDHGSDQDRDPRLAAVVRHEGLLYFIRRRASSAVSRSLSLSTE